jgi:hypothetical protein
MRTADCLLVLCLMGMMGCSSAPSSSWDPQAAESLKGETVALLRNFDAGDFMGLLANADSNLVIMDFDENNAPFRADGIVQSREFMNRMSELAKSQGLQFTSTITRNDAYATANMGYGIVEYDQTISAGGQVMGPFQFRATLIARREGGRWIMTHWHGSFARMPATASDSSATHAAR